MSLFRKIIDWGSGFWRYNLASKNKIFYPRNLIINLTYRCNSKCIMCNIWKIKPKKELLIDDWRIAIKDDVFKKIKQVTISGGEAFLYQDYEEFVKMVIDNISGLKRVVLNTNGFALNVVKNVLTIADYCKLKKIRLSVTLSIDEIGVKHDQIRRVNGGFDKAIEVLDKLKAIKDSGSFFNLNVASVLMNKNINNYRKIRKYFVDKNIKHNFQLIGFHDSYVNNLKEKNSLDFKNKSHVKIVEFLKEMSKKNNFESFYWNDMYEMYKSGRARSTPCVFLKEGLILDSLGDIYYCLSTKPVGNFIKEKRSISEIYFDPKNITIRKGFWKTNCKYCNSGCDVTKTIAYDFKKYFNFKVKEVLKTIFNK